MLLVNQGVFYGVSMTTAEHVLSGTPVVPGVAAGPVLHVRGEVSPDAIARYGDGGFADADAALATWARTVASTPNATTPADLEPLRAVGFDDRQIFAITVFVALRRAFSTVNDALGPLPDHQLRADAPPAVDDAVSFGRPAADQPS